MIPVIGTAVVSNPRWIRRLIASVDYPVQDFIIINNNGRGQITEQLEELTKTPHLFIRNIHIVHLPGNIGVSGAWNLIIKSRINAPFWIIVNDDVAFGPGLLEEMYRAAVDNPEVGLIHAHEGDFYVGSWDLFLIKDFIIEQFGLFDENLYPAYNEDADYIMRFIHRPIAKILNLSANYFHGDGSKGEYAEHGSQTQKSEPDLQDKLDDANLKNIDYLTTKWGPGWRMCSPDPLPFTNLPIGYTTYDLKFVRSKYLGF